MCKSAVRHFTCFGGCFAGLSSHRFFWSGCDDRAKTPLAKAVAKAAPRTHSMHAYERARVVLAVATAGPGPVEARQGGIARRSWRRVAAKHGQQTT